jgi:NAD(P)-dependent dehydrogenase (short-subunit alcohol dehydrogenase family)
VTSEKAIRTYKEATAIVTGAASGIGRALAEELANSDCEVILADRQIDLAEEVASGIRTSGAKAKAQELDVTDFPAVEQLIRETVSRTGRLDYIFNNAGISIGGNVADLEIEHWNQVIDVNLRGVINGVHAAYPVMIEQGFGHIVNISSLAGLMPTPGYVPYGTTKHALIGLSQSLRAEASSMGIRVSVVCPGVIRTPILEGGKFGKFVNMSKADARRMLYFLDKGNPMEPRDFAAKVLNQIAKNKAIILVPSKIKLLWLIQRLSPSLGIFLAQKNFQKTRRG